MIWVVVDAGRKTAGHGDTTARFKVRKDGVPGEIEVSMYESDEAAKLLAQRVAEAMNLLDGVVEQRRKDFEAPR